MHVRINDATYNTEAIASVTVNDKATLLWISLIGQSENAEVCFSLEDPEVAEFYKWWLNTVADQPWEKK